MTAGSLLVARRGSPTRAARAFPRERLTQVRGTQTPEALRRRCVRRCKQRCDSDARMDERMQARICHESTFVECRGVDCGAVSSLDRQLAAAYADACADPMAEWEALRKAEGERVTIIDLYELVASPRGLAPHELPLAERKSMWAAVMPARRPGFQQTEGSDRADDWPEMVPYDPSWPGRYSAWEARLSAELGDSARRIEHVGSTSVPGLAAKPVIDIQVSVGNVAAEDLYVAALERAGVQLRYRDDEHRFFRPPAGEPWDVHVHVCAADSAWERRHLLFRDYLRVSGDARTAYADVKAAATGRWHGDRMGYNAAKTRVILDILGSAEDWAAERRC
jgi:GrpB-like predicted nucleotidyltransferase (UPF0157 family)